MRDGACTGGELNLPLIKPGAIFIADAHENVGRDGFLRFLRALDGGKVAMPPQIFLMGDMFDFLAGGCEYTLKFAHEHINLINKIAKKTQIFYFEGNHDFNLESVFKNVQIYPIQRQPAEFTTLSGERVQIAHGDIFLPFIDKYALRFLRLKFFLKFMNMIDKMLNFKISRAILDRLTRKNLSYKISNFKELMSYHLRGYNANIVIEGHFHQGEIFYVKDKFYINLPSFACEQRYFVVEYAHEKIKMAEICLKGH